MGVDGRVGSFGDALWWSAATITTVGYGDLTPVTFGGRVAGVALMVVGISTFAVITARVAAFLVVDDELSRGSCRPSTRGRPGLLQLTVQGDASALGSATPGTALDASRQQTSGSRGDPPTMTDPLALGA